MRSYNLVLLLLILGFFMNSCEEEFIPAESVYDKELVIESYIEKSDASIPVYAILTYSLPFYSSFNIDVINNSYVKDAEVSIFDGKNRYALPQLCLNDIQEPLRSDLIKNFGYNPDSFKTDLCIYVDLANSIPIEAGTSYELRAITKEDTLYSTTHIPDLVPIDSFWFDKPAGKNANDTFAQLFCIISDIPNQKDYYRYFTAGQNERLIPNVTSVTDDVFFDGQKFKFTLSEAISRDEDFGDNSGLFRRGDTVLIKWCNIPQSHFDFWNTLETSATRQGPFASYVRIKGNIEGGLGIFGGQNCKNYTLYVPKK
ncbi:MAG: DUF4249 domain-containing protein [Saprospiraceae bacterium]|jgi:hypothetical protein|nr:DUF4249 domain-containing protein [Saprospiraceae bacterium]MBK8296275.1 DUF4249 domain-containing protein [Saprospiraceae bacterium]